MSKKKIKHIAIAGNIGAGKTTLTNLLAKNFNWKPQLEEVDNNPYLNDFYEDMPRWSFSLQIFFLNSRYQQILELKNQDLPIIQDRTIYEDAEIFAPNLHAMGLMSSRDFNNYKALYASIVSQIEPPDLMIYMKASIPTLVDNIQKRGRDSEDSIRLDYLKKLNEFYESWIGKYDQGRLLVIDCDKLNFVDNEEDLAEIYNKVSAELNGLF